MSAAEAAAVVEAGSGGLRPRLAIVLGSGLGAVADSLEDRVEVPYGRLPGFRASSVGGHAGKLVLGRRSGVPLAIMSGRAHVYEGATASEIATPIRTLRRLGADTLILTCAAGSLREDIGPGELAVFSDHINLQGFNPLAGPNDDEVGPRFPSLRDAYDPDLRAALHAAAEAEQAVLHEGVYLAVSGPSFETPAEIRAFRTLGADLVGMSTVPETIVARHAGMRVAAIAAVTNLAEGMSGEELSHEQTLAVAARGGETLTRVLGRFLRDLDVRGATLGV